MEPKVLTPHEKLIQNRTMFAVAYYKMYQCTFAEALQIFDETVWFSTNADKEEQNDNNV